MIERDPASRAMQGLLYTGVVRASQKQKFQKTIWDFYKKNGRVLPWRDTKDPYKILVSEVMLQQTQVDRVISKYGAFIFAFPTFEALAEASVGDVLRLWQGLGYNRRALALKRLAEEVVVRHGGHLPRKIAELEELPGIGPYTAAAVAAFAWNEPCPLIETNIRNVYTHFFFESMGQIEDREILPIVEETLSREHPREWYYALMDYGAMLKKTHRHLNSRSKHYTKQSKFEGSDRQLRGGILKILLSGPVAEYTVCTALGSVDERCQRILLQLETEGFIQKHGRKYAIKSGKKLTVYK